MVKRNVDKLLDNAFMAEEAMTRSENPHSVRHIIS